MNEYLVKDIVKEKGIKTVSQFRERLIKQLTKGYCFLYLDAPKRVYEEAVQRQKEFADQLIHDYKHLIPSRIKRDIEL